MKIYYLKSQFLRSNKGVSLIEFLIYISLIGFTLTLMIGFLWETIRTNIKGRALQEVQENIRFAVIKIGQEVKKATGINSPLPGESGEVLSLSMSSPEADPTVIELVDGKLRIRKGTSSPQELTSETVKVKSIQFSNFSYPDTPGTIRLEMVVEYYNPSRRVEYQTSLRAKSTFSLVPGGAD